MKLFFGFVLLSFIFVSCDNTLDVNADSMDIPIVYGIINPKDTAQYIKVERVFRANNESAFDVAQNIDSLYYPDAIVNLVNVSTGTKVELDLVDGALEGYPREGGVFSTDPNYLYKVKTSELDFTTGDYRLEILRNVELPLVTSTIPIVEEPDLRSPAESGNLHFSSTSKLRFTRKESEIGKVMDIVLYIHILEVDHGVAGTSKINTLKWTIVKGTDKFKYALDGSRLFSFLSSNLVEDVNITRSLLSIDVNLIVGGEQIQDYIKLGNANSFSITSSESLPNFTNLSEGYGIFASVNEVYREGYGITMTTRDTLEKSKAMVKYNFNQ